MQSRRRALGVLSAVVATGLVAAGCSGSNASGDAGGGGNPSRGADAKNVTLTIATNAIVGGKNDQEAKWITDYVIPKFVEAEKSKGVTATVKFQPSGVDDEQYKAKISLDLKTGGGPDILGLDGIWVGEFAQANYIKPLDTVVGSSAASWDGWDNIPKAVQANASFDGKRYGIPTGTDGRVLFYNKDLFQKAGLPTDWQPKSWDDILAAARKLKTVQGVTPVQFDAGTAMGEATTAQGFLPLLVGTGANLYDNGKWQGASPQVKDVLNFYKTLVSEGLEDPKLQQAAKGRDESFAEFSKGQIGILAEGDYFWRSVINPSGGIDPMADRDKTVGYAMIPAESPGKGINGQDFVSISGGSGYFLNANTKYPQQAWDLLTFMTSPDALKALLNGTPRITARTDVNKDVLANDPMLSFISNKVLPITTYRPGLAVYPQVSQAIQQATADVVSGKSVDDAAKGYQTALEKVVDGSGNISSS